MDTIARARNAVHQPRTKSAVVSPPDDWPATTTLEDAIKIPAATTATLPAGATQARRRYHRRHHRHRRAPRDRRHRRHLLRHRPCRGLEGRPA